MENDSSSNEEEEEFYDEESDNNSILADVLKPDGTTVRNVLVEITRGNGTVSKTVSEEKQRLFQLFNLTDPQRHILKVVVHGEGITMDDSDNMSQYARYIAMGKGASYIQIERR